jgi:hypothetical protein
VEGPTGQPAREPLGTFQRTIQLLRGTGSAATFALHEDRRSFRRLVVSIVLSFPYRGRRSP